MSVSITPSPWHKIAIKHDDINITYNQLNSYIENVRDQLLRNGVSKGDKIGVIMDNSIEFVVAFGNKFVWCHYHTNICKYRIG